MKKNTKTFCIDGINMQFDSIAFNNSFIFNQKKSNCSKLEYEIELGTALNLSNNAIHNWRFGINGPSDIETIKELAKILNIKDFRALLKKGNKKTMTITERQKDALKRIYDAIIDYLDRFEKTNGFNDLWFDFVDNGVKPEYVEDKLYDVAETELHKIELVVKKEYIELYKLPIYNQLIEYVGEDLCNTFNGKLSYGYRFEAPVQKLDGTQSGITTDEDYNFALKRINELLEEYM